MNNKRWIPISERLPEEGQDVIVGHALGKWIQTDVRYIDGVFRMRENANIGGIEGFKQYSKELPLEKRLFGFSCNPTHWMELPDPPSN